MRRREIHALAVDVVWFSRINHLFPIKAGCCVNIVSRFYTELIFFILLEGCIRNLKCY